MFVDTCSVMDLVELACVSSDIENRLSAHRLSRRILLFIYHINNGLCVNLIMHYNQKTFEQQEQNRIVANCITEYKCHSYVIHWAFRNKRSY